MALHSRCLKAYEEACKHGRKETVLPVLRYHQTESSRLSEEVAAHDLEKKSMEPVWGVFLNRATAEFTVLGILEPRLHIQSLSESMTMFTMEICKLRETAFPFGFWMGLEPFSVRGVRFGSIQLDRDTGGGGVGALWSWRFEIWFGL